MSLARRLCGSFIFLWSLRSRKNLFSEAIFGKRFYGAIPNRFAAVAATAVLFAFEHIPFHAAVRGMSLTEYFAMNWKTLIPLGGKGKDEKTTVIKKRG